MSDQNNQVEICPAQQRLGSVADIPEERCRTIIAMCIGDEDECNRGSNSDGQQQQRDLSMYLTCSNRSSGSHHVSVGYVLKEAQRRYDILGMKTVRSYIQKPGKAWSKTQLIEWLRKHPIQNPACKIYLRRQLWTQVYGILDEEEERQEGQIEEQEQGQRGAEGQGGQEQQQQGVAAAAEQEEEQVDDVQVRDDQTAHIDHVQIEHGSGQVRVAKEVTNRENTGQTMSKRNDEQESLQLDESFNNDDIPWDSEPSQFLDDLNVRESNETSIATTTSTTDQSDLGSSQSHGLDEKPTFTYYNKSGYDKRVLLCVVLGESFLWSDFRLPPYSEVKKGIRSFKPTVQLLQYELQRRVKLGIPVSSVKDMNGLANWLSKHPVCTAREKHYFEVEVHHFVTAINPQFATIAAKQPPNAVPIGGSNNNSHQQQLITIAKSSPRGDGAALKDDSASRNHRSVANISENSSNSNPSQSTKEAFNERKDGNSAYAPLNTNDSTGMTYVSQIAKQSVRTQLEHFQHTKKVMKRTGASSSWPW